MRKICFISIFCILVCVFAQNDSVPSQALIRYSPDCSGTTTTLSKELKLAWIYDTEETIKSTALIHQGRIYVSTLKGKILCLNLEDSAKVWEYSNEAPFSASASIHSDRLHIGNEDGECIALDLATGKEIWKFTADDKIVAAVNYHEDKIVFGAYDNFLYCLNHDGELIWKLETEAPINGMCTIIDGKGIVAGCDGLVRIIDLNSGEEVKHFDGRAYFAATPTVYNNMIFAGTLNGDYYAIKYPEMEMLWQITKDQQMGECYGSASVQNETVVFVSKKRKAFALDSKTGKEKWIYKTSSRIDTSPTISGNSVFFNEFSGNLYRLDLATGKELWKYEAGSRISSSPIIIDNYLAITCEDGSVHVFK